MVRLLREGEVGMERLIEKDGRWMNRWMDGEREMERDRESC